PNTCAYLFITRAPRLLRPSQKHAARRLSTASRTRFHFICPTVSLSLNAPISSVIVSAIQGFATPAHGEAIAGAPRGPPRTFAAPRWQPTPAPVRLSQATIVLAANDSHLSPATGGPLPRRRGSGSDPMASRVYSAPLEKD